MRRLDDNQLEKYLVEQNMVHDSVLWYKCSPRHSVIIKLAQVFTVFKCTKKVYVPRLKFQDTFKRAVKGSQILEYILLLIT
jgi:hypothetical protein